MATSLGILFGIITMLGWGLADFFAAKASRKEGVLKTVLWSQIIGIIVFSIVLLIFFEMPKFQMKDVVFIFIASLLSITGLLSLYKGFEVGYVSVVSPIAASSAAVTVILSMLVLEEKLSLLQGIGVVSVIFGAVLASFKLKDIAKLKLKNISKGVSYGLIAMLSFGISYIFIDVLIARSGWLVPMFLIKALGLACVFGFAIASKKTLSFPRNIGGAVIAIGFLETLAFLSIGAAISYDYTSIVYPIASAFPAATIILARIFFNEIMERNQKIGAAAVVAGLFLLAF